MAKHQHWNLGAIRAICLAASGVPTGTARGRPKALKLGVPPDRRLATFLGVSNPGDARGQKGKELRLGRGG
jgi:hypothetical protein